MFQSIKRSIQLINKDEFDTAIFKTTCQDNLEKPKEKHMNVINLCFEILYIQLIVECLRGENKTVLALDAFTRINDKILAINFQKWVNSLKWGYILHICIYTNCKLFVEAVSSNGLFNKVKQSQLAGHSEEVIKYIHCIIAQNYFNYLQNRYENLQYFQNSMDDFEQKEENQKILVIHKILQTINLILKIEKELDISLQKFPTNQLIKYIAFLLLRDLSFFYPIASQFIEERLEKMIHYEMPIATRVYQNYTDLIRMGRHIKQMLLLLPLVTEFIDPEQVKLLVEVKIFQVDPHKNQEIELFFAGVKQKETQKTNVVKEPPKKFATTEKVEKVLIPQPQQKQANQHRYKTPDTPEIILFDQDRFQMKQEEEHKYEHKLRTHQSTVSLPKTQPLMECSSTMKFTQEQKIQPPDYPEPDEIKLNQQSSSPNKPQRHNRESQSRNQKAQFDRNFNDNHSYHSQTTQQSFFSEYSEARVLGLNKQNSIKLTQNEKKKEGFYDQKQSPLGFISFKEDSIKNTNSFSQQKPNQ